MAHQSEHYPDTFWESMKLVFLARYTRMYQDHIVFERRVACFVSQFGTINDVITLQQDFLVWLLRSLSS